MIQSYPLQWPAGYVQTPRTSRIYSRFKSTVERARDFIIHEIRRMEGTDVIISTNVPVNKYGELRGDYPNSRLDNTGAAVYFKLKGKDVVICCDTYIKLVDNLTAIGKTIENLRAIDRWGVSDFLERAFTGFKGLPEQAGTETKDCWEILGIAPNSSQDAVKAAWKALVKIHHPDNGGSHDRMTEINNAYSQCLKLAS